MYHNTTALEALGPLVAICWDPWRFMNKQALFHIDNYATVRAYEAGRSRNCQLTSTLVRAAGLVAAFLNIRLKVLWQRRRSSRGSIIADDLTHNLTSACSRTETLALIHGNILKFPDPIVSWMTNPSVSYSLGVETINWLETHMGLQLLPVLKTQ